MDQTRFSLVMVGGRPDAYSPDGMRRYVGNGSLNQADNAGVQSGTQRIVLGSSPGYSGLLWLDDPNTATAMATIDSKFVASLTIQDILSGKTGTVSVTSSGQSTDSWLGLPVDLNLPRLSDTPTTPDQSTTSLELGQYCYFVTFGEVLDNYRVYSGLGEQWDELLVIADVTVEPIQTPEPGTAALAFIGLMSAAGWSWKRRGTGFSFWKRALGS
jgi:hypothetical protein